MTDDITGRLILAAEDCEPSSFESFHRFSSKSDRRTISSLIAHGPLLLRGGRGSGKSALMIAASRQLDPVIRDAPAVGVYMSLRHAPLLKSTGEKYGRLLCEIIVREVRRTLGERAATFNPSSEVDAVQVALSDLARVLGKRIVLFFDDAAHLGREASLEEFFDIYRTFSSNSVSCKAAIYPGVTRFGVRFDVYNDATVVDLLRSEEFPDFSESFLEVMDARYQSEFPESRFASTLTKESVASFIAQSCLGNMRGFIFACNTLQQRCVNIKKIGLTELGQTLIDLAGNYYWPLLDEIRPKLGMYEPMVGVAREVAEAVFEECGKKAGNPRDILVHRDIDERLAKPFQILEYAGFVSRREASRALKSGGRGPRYALNLCNLLEQSSGSRLTKSLFDTWTTVPREEAVQFSRGGRLSDLTIPDMPAVDDLAIFGEPLDQLAKSKAYPYGLSQQKIDVLKEHGFESVGDLVDATDGELDTVPTIGAAMVRKIRNVLGQAIWM